MATNPADLPPRQRGERAVQLAREGAYDAHSFDDIYDKLLTIFELLRTHRMDFGGASGTWEAIRTYVDVLLAHYRADVQFRTHLEELTPGRTVRERVRRVPPSLDAYFRFPTGTIDDIAPTDVGRITAIVIEELAPDLSAVVPVAYRTERAPEETFSEQDLRRIVREEVQRRPPRPEIRREGGIVFRAGEVPGAFETAPPPPPAPEEEAELPPPPPAPPTPKNEAEEVAKPPSTPVPGQPRFPSATDVATYSRRELEAFYRMMAQVEKKGILPPADVLESARKRWLFVFHFPPPGGVPSPPPRATPPPPPPPPPAPPTPPAPRIPEEVRLAQEKVAEMTPEEMRAYIKTFESPKEVAPPVPSERTVEQLTSELLRPPYLDDFVTWPMIVRQLEADVRSRNFSRCYLFAGPAGVGKTTLAFAIPRTYLRNEGRRRNDPTLGAPNTPIQTEGVAVFGPDDLEVGQVQLVRTRIKTALSTQPFGAAGLHRFVVLDDVARLSAEAQDALNRVLELYAGRSTVIITANITSPDALRPGLRSRCAARSYFMEPLKAPDIERALLAAATKQHIERPDLAALARSAAERGQGDLRAALDIFLSDLRSTGS